VVTPVLIKEIVMPMVGKEKFPYTKAGMKAAGMAMKKQAVKKQAMKKVAAKRKKMK
jgi:hypothetical protein